MLLSESTEQNLMLLWVQGLGSRCLKSRNLHAVFVQREVSSTG